MEQHLHLQQKAELRQRLSAQQLRVAHLLALPALEFEQKVKDEAEENPAIEVEEAEPQESCTTTITTETYDYQPAYKRSTADSTTTLEAQLPDKTDTMQPDLLQQIATLPLTERQHQLCTYLAGMLEGDGYLRRPLTAIADDVLFAYNIATEPQEWRTALATIQALEPAGIAARNLRECLILQITRKDTPTPAIILANKILEQCFDSFVDKKYLAIRKKLHVTTEELDAAIAEIRRLNPKPGAALGTADSAAAYIVPDFIVENTDGNIVVSLAPRHLPKLTISKQYRRFMSIGGSDARLFAQHKVHGAAQFIEDVRRRTNTLLLVMNAIAQHQEKFFTTGDEMMLLPFTQRMLGERTGCGRSTISRAVAGKFVQTNYGIFPMNYFFTGKARTSAGEQRSVVLLKNAIAQIIDEEDKENPLSDQQIEEQLRRRGYAAARRTISKHREALRIPTSYLRRETDT